MTHDPGGKVRLPMMKGITGGATFSECGRYRRTLWRRWGQSDGLALFIGMNPSTADGDVDDPTVRREILFAQRWGFNGLMKCNIGDYRATDPRHLPADPAAACTAANIEEIQRQARVADLIVMAHGVPPAPLLQPAREIPAIIERLGQGMWCLGTTKAGWPRHPLYVKRDTPLTLYTGAPA